MAPLVRLALILRRAARALLAITGMVLLAAATLLDAAKLVPDPLPLAPLAVALVWLASRVRRRLRAIETTFRLDAEVGGLLVLGAFATVVRVDGDLDGSAFPLVFVTLALISAFAKPAAALVAVAIAIALEIGIRMIGLGERDPMGGLSHLGFMLVFATLNTAILRAEVARLRRASQSRLEEAIDRLRDDARSYRLAGSTHAARDPRARADDEERLLRSGVEEIHQSVLFAMRLLRESLGVYTAMLLWKSDTGTHLRISELASDSPDLSEGPFLAGDGIFGAALSRRAPVSLSGLKPTYKLPYYLGPCPVRAVCVVPVFEHGQLRGAVVVDRMEDRPFSAREEQLVEEAGRFAARAIHNERVFVQLERAKAEQGRLYRAVEALAAAKTEPDVIDAGTLAAREITSIDFAALTLFDPKLRVHEIRSVRGEGEEALIGRRFRHNAGLVSMVLENRHPLPYRGEYDARRQLVFDKGAAPPSLPSLMVLPLVVRDRPLGTLVLGSKRAGVFNDAARSTLEVLASHMAVSLEGARMMRRLEELATMDGLTGLLNKRAMLETADQKIRAAKRFHRELSVVITDIDHFKRVNDTYGHDVGDVIIKGLADILRRAKRDTDAVARFGGEEFVIICEETGPEGAVQLAERVREELKRTSFVARPAGTDGPAQSIEVTCSVGVATFPHAGDSWEELFRAADEALYASKRGGRDRTTVHGVAPRGVSAA